MPYLRFKTRMNSFLVLVFFLAFLICFLFVFRFFFCFLLTSYDTALTNVHVFRDVRKARAKNVSQEK